MEQEDLIKKGKRADWIIRAGIASAVTQEAKDRIDEILFYDGYVEPGYDGELIATGNWNDITQWLDNYKRNETMDTTPSRIGDLLEKIGVEIEWSDEWTDCDECHKLMRTSPDSYGWTPSYTTVDGSEVCRDCLEPEDHFNELEGQPTRVNTLNLDPTDHGYVKAGESFERGFHPGQDADPHIIAKRMEEMGIERFIFHLESKGQFDSRFALYIHEEEKDKLNEDMLTRAHTHGPSVSGAMEAALLAGSHMADKLEGEGIRVVKVTPEGATAKLISHKDFVEGRAFNDD